MPSTNVLSLERKFKKPLMEKRRRARINKCLYELKNILMKVSPNQQHGKIEKADILEMTVAFLQQLTGCHQLTVRDRQQGYVQGFTDCANGALTFLSTVPGQQSAVVNIGLMSHLSRSLGNKLQQLSASPSYAHCPVTMVPLTPISPVASSSSSDASRSPSSPLEMRCPTSVFQDFTCRSSPASSGSPTGEVTVWRPW